MPQTLTNEDRKRLLGEIETQYGGLSTTPSPTPTSPSSPSPTSPQTSFTNPDRARLLGEIESQYYTPERPGPFSRAWNWLWTPPEAVTKGVAAAGESLVGSLADTPPSTSPDFPEFQRRAALRGLTAGALEGVGSFTSPGDLASFLLTGGALTASRRAVKGAKEVTALLGKGKVLADRAKPLITAYNKAAKSAEFWQRAEKVADTVAGSGFVYHGGSTFLEGYREKNPEKMARGLAEGVMGGAVGGVGALRKTQRFPQIDVPRETPSTTPLTPLKTQREGLGLPPPPRPEELLDLPPTTPTTQAPTIPRPDLPPPPKDAATTPAPPGDEGFIDVGGVLQALRPVRRDHSAVLGDKPYQEVVRARELRAEGPSFWSKQKRVWSDMHHGVMRRLFDKQHDLRRFLGTMEQNAVDRAARGDLEAQVALERHGRADPGDTVDLAVGGTIGRMQVAELELSELRKAALAEDLLPELTYYIEHRGWLRNFRIMKEKADEAFRRSEDAIRAGDNALGTKWRTRRDEYLRRMREGEVVPAGKTSADIQRDLDAFTQRLGDESPEALDLVENLSDRYWKDNARYWKLLRDMNVISDDVYRQGLTRGPEYVPLNRIHEAFTDDPDFLGLSSLNAATRRSLKRFEGSSLASIDPFEAAYTWRTRAVSDAARNEVMRGLFNSRNLDPEGLGSLIVPLTGEKTPVGFTKLSFFDKGTKRSFALPDNLAASLQGASPRDLSILSTVMKSGQKALHLGAVGWNLAFAVPNVARDIGRTLILSKAVEPFNAKDVARYASAWGEGLRHVIRSSPEYKSFLWSRASGGTLAKTISPQYWITPPWIKNKSAFARANIPGRLLRTIPEMINVLEETSKMAAFRRLREKGFSERTAALEARRFAGTPDARRSGFDGPFLNLMLMFWNVKNQGKLFAINRFKDDPKRILPAFTSAALAGMALFKWNSQFRDREGRPELAHVPEHDRANNFVFLRDEVNPETGRHLYFKVPVPEEMKWLWIPMNQSLNDADDEFDQDTTDYVQGVASATSSILPLVPEIDIDAMRTGSPAWELFRSTGSALNPAVGIPLEQVANLDFFRNTPIEPRSEQDIAPEERFGTRTSPTAVVLAQAMPERAPVALRSPRRIQHLFRSFGGLSEQILELTDPLSKRWSPQPDLPPRSAEDIPALGVIARRFVGGGHRDQIVEDYETLFYHYYAASAEAARTQSKIASENNPERLREWLTEKPERVILVNLQGKIRDIRDNLKKLSDMRWTTSDSLGLDEDERARRLLLVTQAEEMVLEQAQVIGEIVEQARKGEMPSMAEITPPPSP